MVVEAVLRLWWKRVWVKELCSDCGSEIEYRVWRYTFDGCSEVQPKELDMVFCNRCGRERHKRLNPKDYSTGVVENGEAEELIEVSRISVKAEPTPDIKIKRERVRISRIYWKLPDGSEVCSDCGKKAGFQVWRYTIHGHYAEDRRLRSLRFCNRCGLVRNKRLNPKDYSTGAVARIE